MEPEFPLEIIVDDVPPSSQSSARSKQRWRTRFRNLTKPKLPDGHWASTKPAHVTIYYFPDTEMEGDLDNIVKGILDSIKNFIIVDDRQVERILVEKFEPQRIFTLENPSPVLASALDLEGPRAYIRIDIRGEE